MDPGNPEKYLKFSLSFSGPETLLKWLQVPENPRILLTQVIKFSRMSLGSSEIGNSQQIKKIDE